MKKKELGFLTISLCAILNVSALETIKVMFCNVLNYPPETAVPNREDDIEFTSSDEQPDLFLESQFPFATRDALHNFGDHRPVILSLKANATLRRIEAKDVSDIFYLENNIVDYILELYTTSFKPKNKGLISSNSIGKIVKILATNSDDRQEFDVSGLSNGVYFIEIKNVSIEPLKFMISN